MVFAGAVAHYDKAMAPQTVLGERRKAEVYMACKGGKGKKKGGRK